MAVLKSTSGSVYKDRSIIPSDHGTGINNPTIGATRCSVGDKRRPDSPLKMPAIYAVCQFTIQMTSQVLVRRFWHAMEKPYESYIITFIWENRHTINLGQWSIKGIGLHS
jgi:hypothetical protein